VIAKPPSFFTRFVVVPGLTLRTGEDTGETVQPRVPNSVLCVDESALRLGPMFYDAPARYGIFKIINKLLKSASRGKHIPVSQHDTWTNDFYPIRCQVSSACRSG
jgi:hypothetical protein